MSDPASAMLEVVYAQESAASFGPLSGTETEPDLTSVTLDVVWPEGETPKIHYSTPKTADCLTMLSTVRSKPNSGV